MNKKRILKIFGAALIISILLSTFSTIGIQTKKIDQNNTNKKMNIRPYNGQLRVYIIEPISRWLNKDGDPYHFGFLDFAINETLSIDYLGTYYKQITWDAQQAGYTNIQENNIMVIATVYNPASYKKYAYPPSQNPFMAHYTDATASAKPGEIGYNFKNETFTHTVFCEEGTATWCQYCPATAEALKTVYDTYDFPFYFVAMIADKVPKALDRLVDDYNLYGYPTCFFDGGYKVVVGATTANNIKNNVISSGKRDTHDLNLSISLEWPGNGILDIEVEITNNEEMPNIAPDIPEIIGPTKGKSGQELEYKVKTIDLDGDEVYYCINWGEDTNEVCIGPYPSGNEIILSHTWVNESKYTIKVKAKDLGDHESDYATLDVNIPRINPRFFLIKHNFQNILRIIKIMCGV